MSSQQSFEEGIVFLISTRSTAQKVESRVSRGGAQDFLIPQPVSSRMKSHRLPHSGTNGLNRWVNLYGLKASPITAPYVLIHKKRIPVGVWQRSRSLNTWSPVHGVVWRSHGTFKRYSRVVGSTVLG